MTQRGTRGRPSAPATNAARALRRGASGAVLAALALGTADVAWAQSALAQSAAAPAVPPARPPPAAKPTATPKPNTPRSAKRAPNQAEDEAADTAEVAELLVHPERPPLKQYGAVVGDIAPELQMTPSEIQSYGVSTVTDLLNEIAPQTRSDRGRSQAAPVVLLNGRRISSLNEVANIPTEAILRVDILPEEVALKYGYTADQRVVNIVLRRYFRAVTGEVSGGETTEGGDPTGQAEVDHFQVRRDVRTNIDIKYQAAGGLTDAERDLVEPQAGAPFDFAGNVVSPTGGEIDPALSALVGTPVTIAGVPGGVTAGQHLTLGDFVPTANVANVTDTAPFHSLLPATQNLTANAVFARPIFLGINATLNVTLSGTTSDALQGLPGIGLDVPAGNPFSPFAEPVTIDRYVAGQSPLKQSIDGWTGRLGVTLNRDLGDWRLSLTTAYFHAETDTSTGVGLDAAALQAAITAGSPTVNPFGPLPDDLMAALQLNRARQVTDGGNVQVLANGPLIKVPAGALYVSAKLGDVEAAVSSSTELRGGGVLAQTLARNDLQGQLNLDLPIASRLHHVLKPLGDLSLNANTAVDDYSDFGPLVTLGYGVNWTPVPGYTLIVSETHDHLAPTLAQLKGPVVTTPGVRVFDFTTGQTAVVTQITGGNPNLQADEREVMKIGLTLKPFAKQDFTFTANYVDSHIHNWIGAFPAATAEIEAAFPDRFIRNADGDLVEEDNRTLNFASQDRTELRWGINFSMPVGKQPPPPPYRGQFRRGGGGRGGGGFGGGGGRGGRGGGFGSPPVGGRLQFALYHTIIFQDRYLVEPGGPVLDLLGGAPAGATGGQYQHEIEAQMGYVDNGYGARLSADWKSATTVIGGASGQTGMLNFSDVATVNLRLWDDLSQQRALTTRYPALRGVRVTLNVNNLFDQSIRVRNSAGPTPFNYQSAVLNPTGRVISLNLRKIFY